jgi:hypothetical protein
MYIKKKIFFAGCWSGWFEKIRKKQREKANNFE